MRPELAPLLFAIVTGLLGAWLLAHRRDDGSGLLIGVALLLVAVICAGLALLGFVYAVRFD